MRLNRMKIGNKIWMMNRIRPPKWEKRMQRLERPLPNKDNKHRIRGVSIHIVSIKCLNKVIILLLESGVSRASKVSYKSRVEAEKRQEHETKS